LTKESSSQNNQFSSEEIQKSIEKLREEYSKYSPLHPSGFKLLEFESRYTQILKEKGDLTKFLLIEIDFLERMKLLYEEQKKKAEIMKNSPLNRILEEQESKYTHFPKIDFHPFARREMKYFYGAMKNFIERELYILELIFKGTPEMADLKDCISVLEKTGKGFRSAPSLRITEHILNITARNGDPDYVEKDSQLIIKDTCIALKSLEESIQRLLQEGKINPDMILNIPFSPEKEGLEHFKGLTFKHSLQIIRDSCKEILGAFRMDWLYMSKKP